MRFSHQHQDLRTENGKKIGDLPECVDPAYVAQVAPRDVRVKTTNLDNGMDLVWKANTEPDLAGYRIVWRDTTAPPWQGAVFVGNVTSYRLDLSKDNLLFGVQAIDKDGNVGPATYPCRRADAAHPAPSRPA